MAIGSTNGTTGYTIGGKALGVQLGQKSATEAFSGGASATSLFAANLTASSAITIDTKQIAIKGLQDQIDRLQGFRTDLTPAQKAQLQKYQKTITDINTASSSRVLTKDEITDRAEAYVESYKILGKEYKDFTNDAFIQEKSAALTTLMATKPQGAEATRLKTLQNVRDELVERASSGEGDATDSQVAQVSAVNNQIDELTRARPISSLKTDEIRQHDELVDAINKHAGYDIELTSTQKLKIEHLQKTITAIQSGTTGGLFA